MLHQTILTKAVLVAVFAEARWRPDVNSSDNLCMTKDCIEASSWIFNCMNKSADPCEDFNNFACGNFEATHVIPDDGSRVTPFTFLDEELLKRGKHLVESNSTEGAFKIDALAKNLYKSCMATDKLEETGIRPMVDILKQLGGWPVTEGDNWNGEAFEWQNFVVKSSELAASPVDRIIRIGLERENTTFMILNADAPKFGIKKEYLAKGYDCPEVQHYYTYMVEAAKLFGANETAAKSEMKDALRFELELAHAANNNHSKSVTQTTVKDIPQYGGYPANFTDFLINLLHAVDASEVTIANDEKIIVHNLEYFKRSSTVLGQTEKRVVANYLAFRVVMDSTLWLNMAARKLHDDFEISIKGIKTAEADWKRCVADVGIDTSSAMTSLEGITGSMYVRTFFKPEQKQAIEKMISYIRAAIKSMIATLDWMDFKTKNKALYKLENMDQFIGYPDELLDEAKLEQFYGSLEINEDDYFQNKLRIAKFWSKIKILQKGKIIDPKAWTQQQAVAIVNAYNDQYINSVVFPAGFLQGSFYNREVPMYHNFGSIGSIIGHEITHGFDHDGKDFDFEGTFSKLCRISGPISCTNKVDSQTGGTQRL